VPTVNQVIGQALPRIGTWGQLNMKVTPVMIMCLFLFLFLFFLIVFAVIYSYAF
jgi:hypothetical protein